MREVISLNYIAGIFLLSFQFKLQCLFFSELPHALPSHHSKSPSEELKVWGQKKTVEVRFLDLPYSLVGNATYVSHSFA